MLTVWAVLAVSGLAVRLSALVASRSCCLRGCVPQQEMCVLVASCSFLSYNSFVCRENLLVVLRWGL